MKNNSMKAIALVAALLLAGTAVVLSDDGPDALTVGTVTIDGLTFNCNDDGTAQLTKGAGLSGSVIVPATVEYDSKTYDVTSLGNDVFKNLTTITSVTFPEGITTMGSGVFNGCTGLLHVSMPSTLESYTASNFFNNCSSLEDYVTMSAGTILMFAPNVENVVIPNTVTTIGQSSVTGAGVKTVTMGNNVTMLSQSAFVKCGMSSITLSNNIEIAEKNVFNGCPNLATVDLPESLTYISDSFFSTSGIQSIAIKSTVTSIGKTVFNGCKSLTSITIPESVKTIGTNAFTGCVKLKSVTVNMNLPEIPDNIFSGCTVLDDIEFAYPITKVGQASFKDCKALGSFNLTGVTAIGNNAFRGCTSFETVEIPETLQTFGTYAFYGCSSLKEVVIKAPYVGLGTNAFNTDTKLTTLEIYGTLGVNTNALPNTITTLKIHSGIPFNAYDTTRYSFFNVTDDKIDAVRVTDAGDVAGKIIVSSYSASTLTIGSDIIGIASDVIKKYTNDSITITDNVFFEKNGSALISNGELLNIAAESGVITVPEGVTMLGANSVNGTGASTLILPSTLTAMSKNATSSSSIFDTIYLKNDVLLTCAQFSSSAVYVSSSVTELVNNKMCDGRFISHANGMIVLSGTSSAYSLDVVSDATQVAFKITPDGDFSESTITVKNGDDVLSTETQGEIGGKSIVGYYLVTVTGKMDLTITGLELNGYSLTLPESPVGYTISVSESDLSDITAGTEVIFSVKMLPGYEAGPDFLVTSVGSEIIDCTKAGYHMYKMTMVADTQISVSGVIANDTVTIAFITDGTAVPSQSIPSGSTPEFVEPVNAGNAFMGWFTDNTYAVLFDFSKPLTENKNVYAKWVSDSTSKYTVTFGINSGAITALVNGYQEIESGDSVYSGSVVKVVASPELNYVVKGWYVNEDYTKDVSKTRTTASVDGNLVINAECIYSSASGAVNRNNTDTPTPESYQNVWTNGRGGSGQASMAWSGMVYAPAVYGDYIYTKSDNTLLKIDVITGEVVNSLKTSDKFNGFYEKVIVENGYVLDGFSGVVCDLDLNPVFKLKYTDRMPYSYDGKFYIESGTCIYCYTAEDQDPTKPYNVQQPIWSAPIVQYIPYAGGPTILFQDDWMLATISNGDTRGLATFNVNTGEAIDTIIIDAFQKISLNWGYTDLNDGYATLTGYGSGMFDSSSGDLNNVAVVKIGDDGKFAYESLKVFSTHTNSGYVSAFIVQDGYGFINAYGTFQVYDMDTMELVASDSSLTNAAGAHGSMTISTCTEGKVYAYVMPYNNTTNICFYEFDLETEAIRAVEMVGCATAAQYGSSQVHFAANGTMVYVNDSGKLFGVAKTYKAEFEVEGGEEIDAVTYYMSAEETPLPQYLKSGYKFIGWFDNAEMTGDPIDAIPAMSSGDKIYYGYLSLDKKYFVNNVDIRGFVGNGEAVIIDIDAGEEAPAKAVNLTYSTYLELDEGTFLFPFNKMTVELDSDENTTIFAPEGVHMASVSAFCSYLLDGTVMTTKTVSEICPDLSSEVYIESVSGVTIMFNGTEVVNGETLKYGVYTISASESGYTVNGIDADGTSTIFYHGQKLIVSAKA